MKVEVTGAFMDNKFSSLILNCVTKIENYDPVIKLLSVSSLRCFLVVEKELG